MSTGSRDEEPNRVFPHGHAAARRCCDQYPRGGLMHQVFAIFLRDVKRILKNPVALVVTLGVAIIPSLYAWCNILANWDPYANTGNIQVAVANEDKGTTSTLVGHLDAGQQTVNQLKKNHQLGWRFVPEQQAIEGVESGKYYAA
ncbi:hypothetical protein PNC72_13150, partial [Enterococcus faecium]|nr:hypothetical protein [Enterococcus faecium]